MFRAIGNAVYRILVAPHIWWNMKLDESGEHFVSWSRTQSMPVQRAILLGMMALVVLLMAVSAALLNSVAVRLGLRPMTVPNWVIALGFAPLGFGLYFLRCHGRLSYGVLECAVSIGSIYFILLKPLAGDSVMPILGSLYIMVRGLDNIGKWVQRTGKGQFQWNLLFGEHFT